MQNSNIKEEPAELEARVSSEEIKISTDLISVGDKDSVLVGDTERTVVYFLQALWTTPRRPI